MTIGKPAEPSGYYSMQCMCGYWTTTWDKPQNKWTAEEVKREVEHQIFHLMQQAHLKPFSVGEVKNDD